MPHNYDDTWPDSTTLGNDVTSLVESSQATCYVHAPARPVDTPWIPKRGLEPLIFFIGMYMYYGSMDNGLSI